MRPSIQTLKSKRATRGQHPGLLLQRYICVDATGEDGGPEEKRAILAAAINAASNEEVLALYRIAFRRWSESLPDGSMPIDLKTTGRLIIGLGSENVLETGIRLHHTFGMPLIPGSALKGLAAHYCDQIWGERQVEETPSPQAHRFRAGRRADREQNRPAEPPGDYHELLFGTADESGCIVFHDAWLVPDSSSQPLLLDVMTPHHPRWLDGLAPPTDFDSPRPVPFLSATGTFRVAVSWHGPVSDKAQSWAALARSLVCEALGDWGVGGKTTSGYGRLIAPPPPALPPPPAKRSYGSKARVTIVAPRPKGGFEVQDVESGRAPGTLTLGTPPIDADTNPGAIVDVLVHVDDLKRPQYTWPPAQKT